MPARAEMAEILLPGDTNVHGTAFGGKIVQWMDLCSSMAAGRHCKNPVVTVSIDELHFHAPIRVGEVALLSARLTAAFRTSMEVECVVMAESFPDRAAAALHQRLHLDVRGTGRRQPTPGGQAAGSGDRGREARLRGGQEKTGREVGAGQPGDDVLVNMSVWRDVESLNKYVYESAHVEIMRRRKEWFQRMKDAYVALVGEQGPPSDGAGGHREAGTVAPGRPDRGGIPSAGHSWRRTRRRPGASFGFGRVPGDLIFGMRSSSDLTHSQGAASAGTAQSALSRHSIRDSGAGLA